MTFNMPPSWTVNIFSKRLVFINNTVNEKEASKLARWMEPNNNHDHIEKDDLIQRAQSISNSFQKVGWMKVE